MRYQIHYKKPNGIETMQVMSDEDKVAQKLSSHRSRGIETRVVDPDDNNREIGAVWFEGLYWNWYLEQQEPES